jgi:hypothetical protein
MFEPRRVAPRRGAQLGWEKRLTDADDEQHEEPLVQRKRWACLRFAGANASAGRVSDAGGPTQALGVSPIRGGQRKRWELCLRFAGVSASAGRVSDSQGPTQALGAVSPIRRGQRKRWELCLRFAGGQRKRWACLRFAGVSASAGRVSDSRAGPRARTVHFCGSEYECHQLAAALRPARPTAATAVSASEPRLGSPLSPRMRTAGRARMNQRNRRRASETAVSVRRPRRRRRHFRKPEGRTALATVKVYDRSCLVKHRRAEVACASSS